MHEIKYFEAKKNKFVPLKKTIKNWRTVEARCEQRKNEKRELWMMNFNKLKFSCSKVLSVI